MKYLGFILLFATQIIYSQDNFLKVKDSLYREDQFYFKFTYHTFIGKKEDLASKSIALGFNLGFLRDFPINKKRTWAIAPGFGIGTSLRNNISATEYVFIINNELQENSDFKFSYFNLELPVEIRWRDSSPEKTSFLRVYSGFKLSYLYFFGLENIEKDYLNKIQYGPYISIGYNNWNLYAYYGLNSLFTNDFLSYFNYDASVSEQVHDLKSIKQIQVGFIFYML
jgi:hypothetical protein